MKRIKRILVPVDLTELSLNALAYAIDLAKQLHADVYILHIEETELVATDVPVFEQHQTPDLRILKLKSAVAEVLEKKHFSAHYSVGEGELTQTINKAIDVNKIDLIVMATGGAGILKTLLIGSNTLHVSTQVTVPILVIPDGVLFKLPVKILFATDYAKNDMTNINWLFLCIGQNFNSNIVLVHVSDGDNVKAFEFSLLDNYRKKIIDTFNYHTIDFKLIESKNEVDSLNNYVKIIQPQLIVLSRKEKNWFMEHVNAGLVNNMLMHPQTPLLLL